MYNYFLGDKQYAIKNSWEELSSEEFIFLFELLQEYNQGELTVGDVRTQMALKLLHIDKIQVRTYEQESRFSENIYRIQSQLTFIFRIEYEDKRFPALSPAFRRELSRREPDAFSETPEERLASRFKRHYEVDSVFCKNLMSQIAGVPGYRIENQSGILITDLTASRFCDAVTISDSFIRGGDNRLLDTLLSILYFQGEYEPSAAHQRASLFKNVTVHVKQCVFFNFQSILSFIYNQTKYKVLFGKSEKKAGQYNGGLSTSLLAMGKKFGGIKTVGDAGLIDFLEMMLDSLIEYVRELNAMDKSLVEIAKKTNLDTQTITEMI